VERQQALRNVVARGRQSALLCGRAVWSQAPTTASAATHGVASSSAWPAKVDGKMDESMPVRVRYRALILAASDCNMVNGNFPTGSPVNCR